LLKYDMKRRGSNTVELAKLKTRGAGLRLQFISV
jgi:hypothetical protein